MNVSITKAQTKALQVADLGIEVCSVSVELPNGETVEKRAVEIYDNCGSDFLISYFINEDQYLSFNCASNSIDDLPAIIKSTRELTAVCKYVAIEQINLLTKADKVNCSGN